jgi:AcrR family transcriptional regulator
MHQKNDALAGFPPPAQHSTVGPGEHRTGPPIGLAFADGIGGALGMAIEERYDEILTAASEVIARRGFEAASIREIARAAGLSLAGLYHYVGGKDELLFLVLDRALDQLLASLEAALAGAGTPEARLRALVRTHLQFARDRAPALKVINRDYELLAEPRRSEIVAKRQRYLRRGLVVLRELDPCGRSGDELLSATNLLLGMLNGIATRPFLRQGDDVAGLAGAATGLFLHGFLERSAAGESPARAAVAGGAHDG